MKKFLIVLGVLLLAGAGFLFYQRHKLAGELTVFSGGQTFYAYGLTLEIPAGGTGVRGWLKPYLEVKGVKLGIRFEGKEWKTELGAGKLSSSLWRPSALELSFPAVEWKTEALKLEAPSFHLLPDRRIAGIQARSFRAEHSNSNGEWVEIRKPALELGAWTGFLPDRLAFSWEQVAFSPGRDAEGKVKSDTFSLGKMNAVLASQVADGRRRWEVTWEGEGGEGGTSATKFAVKPWKFSFKGDVHDVPIKEFQDLYREMLATFGALESRPTQEALNGAFSLYNKALPLVLKIDGHPQTIRFEWQGLNFQGDEGRIKWDLGASEAKSDFRYAEKSFAGDSMYLLRDLKGVYPGGAVDAKNLKLFSSVEYKLSYPEFMEKWFHYYGQMLTLTLQGLPAVAMQTGLWALAYYPDSAVYELKADQFSYRAPDTEGAHRNLTLGLKLNNLGPTLYAKGDLDEKFLKDPAKNITGGQADVNFGLRFPWEKALNLIRNQKEFGDVLAKWSQEFAGDSGGLESHWDVNLGDNWFGGKLDLRILMDLGSVLGMIDKLPVQPGGIGRDLSSPKFGPQLAQAFLKKGNLDFALLINRYSKLQALLQKEDPSAVAGLAAMIPFVELNQEKDTLAVHLELKDGNILLNGKRNEWLESQVEKLR